ncbi:hypothetical protein BDV98DRAFT_538658 [Pterulicium gracile]|uniref:RRM domain-containing protein n=1 Tax=Pterulicium gracile TaxID=1884261 RepID=A0A5C3QYZ9_9AGAR|nr:hypothetical protein BDV98DRAFT_538658 [Pterula gracilis]
MASLLERMGGSTGPARTIKPRPSGGASPYDRSSKPLRADPDAAWSHDMYEQHNSLSARLSTPGAASSQRNNSKVDSSSAQKALRNALSPPGSQLSIKGASNPGANVVKVSGLSQGTTADDVRAIFNACGTIVSAKVVPAPKGVAVEVQFKEAKGASEAVSRFHNQPADGGTIIVTVMGSRSSGTTLVGRIGNKDGLDLVRGEGSVDLLMQSDEGNSKMRSDSLLKSERAHVLVAPPGANPADYQQSSGGGRGGGRRGGRGRGARRGRGGGRMDVD